MQIRTVLCPVDVSLDSTYQIELAADLCRLFKAVLVLHHNVVAVAIGSGVGWMWAPGHQTSDGEAERMLRDLIARVPEGTRVEGRLTHGPVGDSVAKVVAAVDADLVVLSTHGTADDHAGVTSQVLADGTRSIFALHEAPGEHAPLFMRAAEKPHLLLVPTDLTRVSSAAVELALDLARQLPVALHLLHVITNRSNSDEARASLARLVPADLDGRVTLQVEHGDAARTIARVASDLGAACIIMGEHHHGWFRHLLRPDTTQAVLERTPCSVWYVPSAS